MVFCKKYVTSGESSNPQTGAPTYYLTKLLPKLHEHERNWAGGGGRPWRRPLSSIDGYSMTLQMAYWLNVGLWLIIDQNFGWLNFLPRNEWGSFAVLFVIFKQEKNSSSKK